MPSTVAAPSGVDSLMERASGALLATDYFEAAALARRALGQAFDRFDMLLASRICLPLQEARRQVRQLALDAAEAGSRFLIASAGEVPEPMRAGFFLLQPPLIGADGRNARAYLEQQRIPGLVLVREPLTQRGKWPVVSVGDVVLRAQVDPPYAVERDPSSPTRDTGRGAPGTAWFLAAQEALGDAAIAAALKREQPAAHRAEELLEAVDALPDHEKLYQRLAEACREASGRPRPTLPRTRGPVFPMGL